MDERGNCSALLIARPGWISRAWIVWPAVLLTALVVSFPYLPLSDYPDWLYQGFLLKEIWLRSELAKDFMVAPYLPPNSLVTLLIATLSLVMPVMLAGKAVLALSLVGMCSGLCVFLRTVSRCSRWGCALVALLLTPSYFFFQGNLGYMLGLGIALWTPRILLEVHGRVRSAVLAALLVLAYLSHFLGLAFLMLFLAYDWYHGRRVALAKDFLLPLVVLLVLFLHYVMRSQPYLQQQYHDGYEFRGAGLKGLLIEQASMFVGPLKPCRGFIGISRPSLLRESVNMIALLVFLAVIAGGVCLGARHRNRQTAMVVFLIALALMLPSTFKGMTRPGERFVPVIVAICFAMVWEYGVRLRRVMLVGVGLIVATMFSYHIVTIVEFNRLVRNVGWRTLQEAPAVAGWHYPFRRFRFYEAVDRRIAMGGSYITGMILPRCPPTGE